MSVKIGLEAKLYYCPDGIGGTPSWMEIASVKDVTLNQSKGEADVSTRGGGGWKAVIGTLKEATIEFELVADEDNAAYTALQDAYINNTSVGLAVMNGPIATAGSKGLWADCAILKFDRKEPLEQAITISVTAKPTWSVNPPQRKVIAGA